MDQHGDRDSLARLPALLAVWQTPRRVVVHCSAGLHRTGAMRIGGANGPAELKKLQIVQVRLGTRSPSGPPDALENSADPLG